MSLIDNYANASVIATMQSSAFNLNVGAPKPPNTFDGINAMVEIHPDTPLPVRSRFGAARRLYFQFIEDGIPDSGNPRYNSIDVAGRSESYMAYAGGENRKVSLTLGFVSSVNQGDEGEAGVAVRCAEWLRAVGSPSYFDGGISYGPPVLRLILGRFISMRCVLTNLNVTHSAPWVGGLSRFEYPLHERVEVEFTEVNNRPKDTRDYLSMLEVPGR